MVHPRCCRKLTRDWRTWGRRIEQKTVLEKSGHTAFSVGAVFIRGLFASARRGGASPASQPGQGVLRESHHQTAVGERVSAGARHCAGFSARKVELRSGAVARG